MPLGPHPPLWDVREDLEQADTVFRAPKGSTPTTAPVVARDEAAQAASRAQRKRRVLVVGGICVAAFVGAFVATRSMGARGGKTADAVDTMVSALSPPGGESAAPPAAAAPGEVAEVASAEHQANAAVTGDDAGPEPVAPPESTGEGTAPAVVSRPASQGASTTRNERVTQSAPKAGSKTSAGHKSSAPSKRKHKRP
jgi:hypothetical protein